MGTSLAVFNPHSLRIAEPDGANVLELINETTSPTGGHLFVVNLDTLEQRILQAQGLSLDSDWSMPSWRQ